MRNRICLVVLLAFVLVGLPQSLLAQFQQPTEEELKMTAEAKAPDQAAIYLYREETVDDNLHYHGFYERVKVLTEKGKELATVNVPYSRSKFQITDIKARTIHPDGTVVPLNVKPEDLLMSLNTRGSGQRVHKMVFTLPSVEVGSILEYRWQIRYDDEQLSTPFWDIQQPYFVRRAHYSFVPFKYMDRIVDGKGNAASHLLYTTMLPENAKVVTEASGKYTLDVTDVAPQPDEEFMPPVRSLMERVVFYYTPYVSKDDFWKHEGGSWSKEMDRFANESKTLKDAVDKIVAPGDTEEQKARKIYDAVMAIENTAYTRSKSKAEMQELHLKRTKNAEDVWAQKSGTGDEIALLYLAMVRIAGIKAYAITVCNRNVEVFNPYYLSLDQFDDVLVGLMLNGKEIPVDPGKRFATFGQLAWNHTQVSGMQQSDHGPSFMSTPVNSYKQAVTFRVADVQIAKDGSVTGTVRVSMTGPEATRWRELAIENDEDEIKKRFDEHMRSELPDGVTADFDHFLGLEDYKAQLMAVLKISGNMGTMTGKRVFLPAEFFESRAKHPFVAQEKRLTAVSMEYASSDRDEVHYYLPDGYVVESAPATASVPWAGFGVFEAKSTVEKDHVTVDRTLSRAFSILEPKQYPALRDFYQKIAAADQEQLVLTATPARAAGSE